MRRRRGSAFAGDLSRNHLDDLEVHVGGGEREPSLLGPDHDVGENGDGVAALDHALNMSQGSEQRGAFDCEFHG